ncbi:MAG: hypothetical protein WC058_08800 [Phycisphaeraceae bacterium]
MTRSPGAPPAPAIGSWCESPPAPAAVQRLAPSPASPVCLAVGDH